MLQVLVDEGLAVAVPERHGYALGIGVFELGSAYLRHQPLENIARPLLRRLVGRVKQTSHLGILYGHETLYLLKEQPPRPSAFVTAVGVRLPAHLTATGRAMLAHLPSPQVNAIFSSLKYFVSRTGLGPRNLRELKELLERERRRGWAMETGETTEGVTCISAPVFDHNGYPLASVSVSLIEELLKPRQLEGVIAEVCRTAEKVTECVGGVAPSRLQG